jgi:hypothetical protein
MERLESPDDSVDPRVQVCERDKGDDAGDKEPGHVRVPENVVAVEAEGGRSEQVTNCFVDL